MTSSSSRAWSGAASVIARRSQRHTNADPRCRCPAQIPLRFDPVDNNLMRTGYYYLPSQWQNKALPVMVLFHGLEGYGLNIIQAGSGNTFQVSTNLPPAIPRLTCPRPRRGCSPRCAGSGLYSGAASSTNAACCTQSWACQLCSDTKGPLIARCLICKP